MILTRDRFYIVVATAFLFACGPLLAQRTVDVQITPSTQSPGGFEEVEFDVTLTKSDTSVDLLALAFRLFIEDEDGNRNPADWTVFTDGIGGADNGLGVKPGPGSTGNDGKGVFFYSYTSVPSTFVPGTGSVQNETFQFTFKIGTPASFDDGPAILIPEVAFEYDGDGGISKKEATRFSLPGGPTLSNPVPATDELSDGPAVGDVDFTVIADGTNSVTFSVDATPLDGLTIDRAGFIVANAAFADGRWEDIDPLTESPSFNNGTLNDYPVQDGEVDVIEFAKTHGAPTVLSVVPSQGGAALDHQFEWSPSGSVPGSGGTFSITWTPPVGLVTKGLHPSGKVFYVNLGAIQSNGGISDQSWVVRVVPVNRAPEADDEAVTTDEDTALPIDVLANDIDPDDEGTPGSVDTLTVTAVTQPSSGMVAITNVGADVSFDPVADFQYLAVGESEVVTFDYTVSDGTDTDTETVTVTITGQNELPVFSSTTAVDADENQTAVQTVTATDVDASNVLTFSITGGADAGAFSITADGVLTFDAAPDFETATDANTDNDYVVEVTVNDGTATVSQTITVTVKDLNELPVFTTANTTPSFAENTVATDVVTTVSATDEDAGADPQFSITGGADGDLFSITADGGLLTFNASPDFDIAGDADSDNDYEIEVTASNDGGTTVSQTITVSVTNVNEAPSLSAPAEAQIVVIGTTVPVSITFADPDTHTDTWQALKDNAGSIELSATTLAGVTVAVGDTPNTIDVTVADGVLETDGVTFTVKVTDLAGAPAPENDDPVTVTVNVIANQQPIVSGEAITDAAGAPATTVNELETLDFAITFDDSPNTETGDNGVKDVFWRLRVGGAVVAELETDSNAVTTGAFSAAYSFTPDQDLVMHAVDGFSKDVQIEATAVAHGAQGAPRTFLFDVEVFDVNREPTIAALVDETVLEDAGEQEVALTGITDGDGDAQTLTVTVSSDNQALIPDGNLEIVYASPGATGTLKYTPVAEGNGSATITVTVTDDASDEARDDGDDDTVEVSFVVTVTPVNDVPTIDQVADFAVDEDSAAGTVTLTGVTDGDAEVEQTLTVTVSSDNPTLIPDPTLDGDVLTYEPQLNQFGAAVITVTVNDGAGTENGGVEEVMMQFTITVTPVNDAPVAADGSGFSKTNDTTTISELTLSGTDVDDAGAVLSIWIEDDSGTPGSLVEVTAVGQTFTTAKDGEIEVLALPTSADADGVGSVSVIVDYTPPADLRGVDEFFYVVRDDDAGTENESDVAVVRVTVGTPQWYPFFSWTGDADGWYNVKIFDAGGTKLFETNVNGTEMTVSEYFLAGSEGLLPGTYTAEVAEWDPVADTIDSTSETVVVEVDDYLLAEDATLTGAGIVDQGSGCYQLNFIVANARGYELVIVGQASGYQRTIRQIFRPDDDNVVPLSQAIVIEVKVTTADVYDVLVRGFNPQDEDAGLATFDPADADDAQEDDGFIALGSFTLAAAEDAATPAKPLNLLPKAGELIPLVTGETTITRTLEWDPVPGASSYVVYLAASDAKPILNYRDVGTATRVTVTMPAGSYYWMVIARTEGAATPFGSYSDPQQFVVVDNIAGPVVVDVDYDDAAKKVRLTMADGSAAPATADVWYFVADDNDGSWVQFGIQAVDGTDGNAISLPGDLAPGASVIYFRIRAISATGVSGPSQLHSDTP